MLRSWSLYHEQNGCISLKIKFDNIGDAVNRDNMTYKRKTASQAARNDRRRSDQWNTRKSTVPHSDTCGAATHSLNVGAGSR